MSSEDQLSKLKQQLCELIRRRDVSLDDINQVVRDVRSDVADDGESAADRDATVELPGSTGADRNSFAGSAWEETQDLQRTPAPSVPAEGSVALADYELLEEIARGGMGVVFKARQISLNRIVALKMMLAGQFAASTEIRRFRLEAEAAANLDHPGIVPVYEFGEHEGRQFLSMGFVEGRSLARRIGDSPLAPRPAAELLVKICRAVAYAHEQGVIHRDLKPGNVLLDAAHEPRVTDFGLAKKLSVDSGMTATGQILGTPSYMPPEQATGGGNIVDRRADVYSLGAILYATLTGRPPFQAANAIETLKQVVEREAASPRQLNPSIPRDLETICLKCLRKEADGRYDDAAQLGDDLQRWLDGEPIFARRVSRGERVWKWCRRRPAISALSAVVFLAAVVAAIVFWERRNAAYAEGLVERLQAAEPRRVDEIVKELTFYRWWVEDELRTLYERSPDESFEKLRAALGLLQFDEAPLGFVQSRLLSLPSSEFGYVDVIGNALGDHGAESSRQFWERLHDRDEQKTVRFLAGLALAHQTPDSERWTSADETFMSEQLVATNPVFQRELWRLLGPIKTRLLEPLETIYLDNNRNESQRAAAANALAEFCPDQPERLVRLLVEGDATQFGILMPVLKSAADEDALGRLARLVPQQPAEDLEPAERIALGRRRAKAAIALLRFGERTSIFNVLRYDNDPEAMTQFIHLSRDYGVLPGELKECFELVDESRGPLDGTRSKVDSSVMYALLLTLGEYPGEELGRIKETLAPRLNQVYARDPSSAVHSACGWLLRQWVYDQEVTRVDQTPLPYDESGHREWYVLAIECTGESEIVGAGILLPPEETLYFTMIVLAPGEYEMGSPENEPARDPDEAQHRVRIEFPVAVCDRELAWRQLIAKEGNHRREAWNRQFVKDLALAEPVFGFNWFETIDYCVWLTTQAELPSSEQCYTIPENTETGAWSLDLSRRGFRQPTEREWEYACRGGTTTAWSFGHDETWLSKYAWYLENANDWSRPVAELRPNPRGLFDMHGNLYEWCYDWYGTDFTDSPSGPPSGSVRVNRGGSWNRTARSCRSPDRGWYDPSERNSALGFRLAALPSSRDVRSRTPESGAENRGR